VLEALKVLYGDQSHADMAGPSAMRGLVHWARGEVVKEAIQCCKEALEVLLEGYEIRRGICYNLGCAHYLSATQARKPLIPIR
jgi:hypothetical protein